MEDDKYIGGESLHSDNYIAEMVHAITDVFNGMRELYIKASILDCMNKGEFDLLGGVEKYDFNNRIFGISYEGDIPKSSYPQSSIFKNKQSFYESINQMNMLGTDLKGNSAKLLSDFLKISGNRYPRDVVLVQRVTYEFTTFGGIVPKVYTSFENKIDYLGKELIGSTINNLEKLYSEE
jgi:hypothetical protein